MSFEGKITDVIVYPNGSALVELGGKTSIKFENVPSGFDACVGTTVYEKDGVLMVGDRVWAKMVRGDDRRYALVVQRRKPKQETHDESSKGRLQNN